LGFWLKEGPENGTPWQVDTVFGVKTRYAKVYCFLGI
jgi:hypothetical protein